MMYAICLLTFGLLIQQDELKRFEASQPIMGVEFSIIVYAKDEVVASAGVTAAFAEIEAMNAALSDYDPESEINLVCRSAPHEEPVNVSERVYETIQLAMRVHEETNGAFDVSIGPVSQVWREARRQRRLPEEEALEEAKSRMGLAALRLQKDRGQSRLAISKASMQLDFGGIAKGLAADRAMEALKARGINSALINASGDVLASGSPPGKKGWTIQIPSRDPELVETIQVSNLAVATSGDVFQYLEVDGVRYSHIIDPKTAMALTEPRIVTVVCKAGGLADALASTLSVRGREGFSLAETYSFEAQVIEATNRDLTEYEIFKTDNFPASSSQKSDDQ